MIIYITLSFFFFLLQIRGSLVQDPPPAAWSYTVQQLLCRVRTVVMYPRRYSRYWPRAFQTHLDSSPRRPKIWSATMELDESFRWRTRPTIRQFHDARSFHRIWVNLEESIEINKSSGDAFLSNLQHTCRKIVQNFASWKISYS